MKIVISSIFFGILFVTTLYSQWEICNKYFLGGTVNSLLAKDGIIMAGTYGGFYISSDNGNNWSKKNFNQNTLNAYDILVLNNGILIGTDNFGVLFSSDMGKNWIQMNNGLTYPSILSMINSNDTIMVGTNGFGPYLSIDGGNNWVAKNIGIKYGEIRALKKIENLIYLGTNLGGVYFSSNLGNNWVLKNKGLNKVNINTIQEYGQSIFIGADDGLFSFSESDSLWKKVNLVPENIKINKIIKFENTLLVGTDGFGIFISDDGINWLNKSNGLLDLFVISMTISNDMVFAGTHGNGIFRAKLIDITSVSRNILPINSVELSPNPATDYIIIVNPWVEEIQIIDIFGNRVLNVGTIHELPLRIDVSALPAGVYFLRFGEKVSKFIKI